MPRLLCVRAGLLLLLVPSTFGCPGDPQDDDSFADDDDASGDDDTGDDDASGDDDTGDDDAGDDDTVPGPCADPVAGWNRFGEEAAERGLGGVLPGPVPESLPMAWGEGGRLVVEDLDADGDLDLVFGPHLGPLRLFRNDGTGHFERLADPPSPQDLGRVASIAAVDLDGDDLPELILSDGGKVYRWAGVADLAYGEPQGLFGLGFGEEADLVSVLPGDVDGDGDLDLLAVTGGRMGAAGPLGVPELLALDDGGVFHETQLEIAPRAPGYNLLVAMLTDADRDGRLDLLLPTDDEKPSALLLNAGNDGDGLPILVDQAAALGFEFVLAAMGIDSADLNGDGVLDYCMTDTGAPVCMLSFAGTWVDSSAALGLVPDEPLQGNMATIGWGIALADLDNDGWIDVAQAAAPHPDDLPEWATIEAVADLLWFGGEGGFTDMSAELGFDSLEHDLSVVAADLDGDGWLDLLRAGADAEPSLWMNRCGPGRWLEVELRGPAGNRQGFGAQVSLAVGAGFQVREIHGPTGPAQGPSRAHFGLGDGLGVGALQVRWIDGTVQDVPVDGLDRLVVVEHP